MTASQDAHFGAPTREEVLLDPISPGLMQGDAVRSDGALPASDAVVHRIGEHRQKDQLCRLSRLCDGILPIGGAALAFAALILVAIVV